MLSVKLRLLSSRNKAGSFIRRLTLAQYLIGYPPASSYSNDLVLYPDGSNRSLEDLSQLNRKVLTRTISTSDPVFLKSIY